MVDNKMTLLTPHNYYSWKTSMVDLLRSKGLYSVTIRTETKPTREFDKAKWLNRCDEAQGLISILVSEELKFHIQDLESPNESWEKLKSLFRNTNVI